MLAIPAALFFVWGAAITEMFGGVATPSDEPNGDPCCPVPDTWGEVYGNALGVALCVGLAAGFLALAVDRLGRRRRDRVGWRHVARRAGVVELLALIAVFVQVMLLRYA